MKKLATLILLALAASSVASAASSDRSFYMKAAAGGMAEVETGKLAQQKGSSEAVKSFGAKMVEDHTAANQKLMAIAANKKIKLPTAMDAKHKAMHKKLSAKSGADFDSAYIQGQIADHKATIALFEREIASGKDAEAKAFASETLPVVQSHLTMLQAMSGEAVNSPSMGGRPGSSPHMAPGSSGAGSQMNSNMPGGMSGAGGANRSGTSTGTGNGATGMGSGTSGAGAGAAGGAR